VILSPGNEKRGECVPWIENAVYLYDVIPHVVDEGPIKSVIFASPNHRFLKEHSKNSIMSVYYMPL
jgi:hypothetical protein